MYGSGALGGSSSVTLKRGLAVTTVFAVVLVVFLSVWLASCNVGLNTNTPQKERYNKFFSFGNDDFLIVSIALAMLLSLCNVALFVVATDSCGSRRNRGMF